MRRRHKVAQRIDASTMRQLNKATVLHCVRARSPISRIEIAETTGLNKATVSSLVDELMDEQFVVEVGYGHSKGGRKPILLEFNADAAFTVGLDVQITHVTTTLCNANGTVRWAHTVPMDMGGTDVQEHLLALITAQAANAMAAAPPSPHGVLGIGIALPGMVNFHNGHVYMLPNMGVVDWDIRSALMERFRVPVFVDNDANCGAWAAYRMNPTTKNLVYISAGIGIGAGIVIGGQLYRGSRGVAGEYGHTTIVAMGVRCTCGNYGCWERYAAEESLLCYLAENGVTDFQDVEEDFVEKVVRAANKGNHGCVQALVTLGRFLGIGMANIANTLNPDAVFFGGHLSHAYKYLLPQLKSSMDLKSVQPVRETPILLANSDSVAIGAAGIALAETLYQSDFVEN
jgi:N-acetylglucosamine repressor